MKATGIVRRIDDLGCVVVPKEIRRTLRLREGTPLEIFTDREGARLTVATDVTGAAESIRTMRVDAWKRFWLEQPEEARALPKLPTVFALLAAPSGAVAPRYAPVGASRKGEKKGEKHGTFAKSVKSDKRGKPAGHRAQAAKSSHADRTSTGRPTKGARR